MAIEFVGVVVTSAGVGARQPIDFVGRFVFLADKVEAGQVTQFTILLSGFSDGYSPLGHQITKVPVLGNQLEKLIG